MTVSTLAPYDLADPLGNVCFIAGMALMALGLRSRRILYFASAAGFSVISLFLQFNPIEVWATRRFAFTVDTIMLIAVTVSAIFFVWFVFRSITSNRPEVRR